MSEAAHQIDRLRVLVVWLSDVLKAYPDEHLTIKRTDLASLADVITTAADTLEQHR